jgi:hypothetical protein
MLCIFFSLPLFPPRTNLDSTTASTHSSTSSSLTTTPSLPRWSGTRRVDLVPVPRKTTRRSRLRRRRSRASTLRSFRSYNVEYVQSARGLHGEAGGAGGRSESVRFSREGHLRLFCFIVLCFSLLTLFAENVTVLTQRKDEA